MTLVSGSIRFMQIFMEVPWEGTSNDSGVVENGNFQLFCLLFFSHILEMRPALL